MENGRNFDWPYASSLLVRLTSERGFWDGQGALFPRAVQDTS